MTKDQSPGVYIQEIEIGAKPIEGVATSVAAFLGAAERGPTEPTETTSWPDYQRKFGGMFGPAQYLPYAAKGFFDNGGQRLFVTRIVSTAAVSAAKAFGALTITAIGEGTWGNRIYVSIEEG